MGTSEVNRTAMAAVDGSGDSPAAAVYGLIRTRIRPHLRELARHGSTARLQADPVYQSLAADLRTVLETPEIGGFAGASAPPRPRYRFLAWNIERGIELDGQMDALRSHPYLRTCDVLLLTEADLGMARSKNRAVARELARELEMHYAFAPCYLNLAKGAGVEYHVEGENDLGLHGNALLSRYPIGNVRLIRLRNGIDKMAGREKRLGSQTAIAADIHFPNYRLTAVSVHLDANSSQRHRREQMAQILGELRPCRRVIIGGDWNTTTYNSSRALFAIAGFARRVLMGVDHVIRNHYLYPDRYFERGLFELLEAEGFDYRLCNRLGERTATYDAGCPKTRENLGEWVPGWCFAFIRWSLRNHGGVCPLKIDWFATRNLCTADPVVIHDVREGRATPLSDHDAIGVDVVIE
jgi:endonuclease/exonuclease/phosphatase family metal-dependent hydrolase